MLGRQIGQVAGPQDRVCRWAEITVRSSTSRAASFNSSMRAPWLDGGSAGSGDRPDGKFHVKRCGVGSDGRVIDNGQACGAPRPRRTWPKSPPVGSGTVQAALYMPGPRTRRFEETRPVTRITLAALAALTLGTTLAAARRARSTTTTARAATTGATRTVTTATSAAAGRLLRGPLRARRDFGRRGGSICVTLPRQLPDPPRAVQRALRLRDSGLRLQARRDRRLRIGTRHERGKAPERSGAFFVLRPARARSARRSGRAWPPAPRSRGRGGRPG